MIKEKKNMKDLPEKYQYGDVQAYEPDYPEEILEREAFNALFAEAAAQGLDDDAARSGAQATGTAARGRSEGAAAGLQPALSAGDGAQAGARTAYGRNAGADAVPRLRDTDAQGLAEPRYQVATAEARVEAGGHRRRTPQR